MSVSYHIFTERQLQLKLCYDDLRPPVNEKAPRCYVNLMNKCWDKELCKPFIKWQKDGNVLLELNNSILNLKNHMLKHLVAE
ncbi:2127_t:CDS:1, partial [Cetraspora pellucida]